MSRLVIGLMGHMGAGKQTFCDIAKKVGEEKGVLVTQVSTSGILADTLKLWKQPKTRENFQNLAIAIKDAFGEGALMQAIWSQVVSADGLVIVDSVRWEGDYEAVLNHGPHTFIGIEANIRLRWLRRVQSQEKVGESALTLEAFFDQHGVETERFIDRLLTRTNIILANNSTLEEFESKVRICLDTFVWPHPS